MKRVIPMVLLLVVLAGCATSGNCPHPYDRGSNQVKCKTCGQWYDGVPVKVEATEEGGDTTPKNVCEECGRTLAQKKGKDFGQALGEAALLANVIIYGGIALFFAGIIGLAFA